MINLTGAQLRSVQLLFNAIEQYETLLKFYSENKPGPAYLDCNYVNGDSLEIQLDRAIMTTAIRSQLTMYHDALTDMGVTYTKPEEIG